MKYGIVGSRSRTDKHNIVSCIYSLPPSSIVVSGGAAGVDTWAVEAAKNKGLEFVEFLPDLAGCERRWQFTNAYHARNKQIANECDILVAFVSHNRKGGTENTIMHATRLGKKVVIVSPGHTATLPL